MTKDMNYFICDSEALGDRSNLVSSPRKWRRVVNLGGYDFMIDSIFLIENGVGYDCL